MRVPHKIYNFTSPDGVNYTIQNLRCFCEEMNLNYPHMNQVHLGTDKHYKGWRAGLDLGVYPSKLRRNNLKYRDCHIEVTAPDGTNHTITNLTDFCNQHNLNQYYMVLLIEDVDDVYHVKGWRLGHDMGEYEDIIKLPDDVVQRIIKLANVCTVRQISERLEIHHTTVVKYLKKYNIHVPRNRRPTKLDEEQKERIRKLSQTCTISELAERFSVTKTTIRSYLDVVS